MRWERRLPVPAEHARDWWYDFYEQREARHPVEGGAGAVSHRSVVRGGSVAVVDEELGTGRARTRVARNPDGSLSFETRASTFLAHGRVTFDLATTTCRIAAQGVVEPRGLGKLMPGLEQRVEREFAADLDAHAAQLEASWRKSRGLPPAV